MVTTDVTAPAVAAATSACLHCGLPAAAAVDFCCEGCRTVYGILHAQGLSRYYLERDKFEGKSRPAKVTGKSYGELDDPLVLAKHTKLLPDGSRSAELYLEGVHCAACVWLLERAQLDGMLDSRVDLGRRLVHIRWDPRQVALSAIARRFDSLGYAPHPSAGAERRDAQRREDRRLLVQLAIAGACFGNAMLMAFALYGGLFAGMEREYEQLFRWGSFALAIPSVLGPGSVFWKGAWRAVRERTPHMDLPLGIGIVIGFVSGAVNTIRGTGEIYFDSVMALIFLLLVGRWLQRRQQRRAAEAAELLYSLAPQSARLIEGEAVREVPIEAVERGALLEVRAGEHVPADGVIECGSTSIDASLLTGESRPVAAGPGDRAHAGTINLSERIVVRAEETGADSRLGKLLKMVDEAARRRAPIVLAADRASAIFVKVILTLAVITFAGWWLIDPSRAIDNTVALLIVTCPCALGLATPLAVSAAIGRAARAGILIKGGDALERLARPGLILFDKTGTLTEGRQRLVEWSGDRSVMPLVAAIEAHSAHPIARTLVSALPGGVSAELVPSEIRQTLGAGIEARAGGAQWIVGSPTFVESRGATVASWAAEARQRWSAEAHTTVFVSRDGQVIAAAAIGDALRDDAASSLSALRRLGYDLGVLSGDDARVVSVVAGSIGVSPEATRGGVSPEGKLQVVEDASSERQVIMVGDGVNDAAALSRAAVGVAVHGGAEASLAAADVFLDRPGVGPIVELIEGARRTMRVIKRNMAFSLSYNATLTVLAMAGLINPLIAAILMPLSSLTVVASSYRSRTFGGER